MNPELSGRSLTFARLGWITFALTLTILQFSGQIAAFRAAQELRLPLDQIQDLNAIGLSVTGYGAFKFFIGLLNLLAWGGMGFVIFWQKSRERGTLILSAMMLGLGMAGSIPTWEAFADAYPAWVWVVPITAFIGNLCLYSFFFVFPTGRYVPRWTVGLALGLSTFNILNAYQFALPSSLIQLGENLEWLFPVFFITIFISFILIPIYRYRRVSTPIEREQIRLVIFTVVIGLVIFAGTASTVFLFPNNIPGEDINFITVFVQPLGWTMTFVMIPIAIAISILRHRLFDIDVIIRRTLQYSLLTGLLALTYFGSIVLLQNIFFSFPQSEIAIVLSTLAIAALFNPLRIRIQNFIDRRFYRKKYNAEQALAQFAETARDEVDMEKLTAALIGVVQETMQPESVSLWLKDSGRVKREK